MSNRNVLKPLFVAALTVILQYSIVATGQQSQPTRIDKYTGDLDPGLVESEMIEGTISPTDLSESGGIQETESYFNGSANAPVPQSEPIVLKSRPATQSTRNGNSWQPQTQRQEIAVPPPAPETGDMNQVPAGFHYNNGTTAQRVSYPEMKNGMYETKSTPTIQTNIVAPRTINVNQTARLFIQAQNVGTANVQTVKILATLPDHAKFVSAAPMPTHVNGQEYEFTLNGLQANGKQVIQLDVIPTSKLPLNIVTQLVIESQQQVAVTVQQPVLDVTVNGPQATPTGKTVTHVVTVRNIGDGVAESVRIQPQLPDNLELTEQPQKTLVPKLAPGQSAKFELSSFARLPGDTNVAFQVSADGAETRSGQTALRVIRPELDVQILGPRQNFLGRDGVYSIELENASEIGINDVQIQLQVPAGLQVNTISQQAKVDKNSGVLNWTFASIPGKQKQVIQLRAKALSEGDQVCNINVRTKETGSKQLTLTTNVQGRADLGIRVFDSGEPVGVGSKSDFTVEVANYGSRNADNVTIQVELPPALMAVNQQGYSVDPSGNYITFNNIGIESGMKRTFTFKVVAVSAGEHIVRGSVSQEGSTQTISAENSIFVFESENARVSEALVPEIR